RFPGACRWTRDEFVTCRRHKPCVCYEVVGIITTPVRRNHPSRRGPERLRFGAIAARLPPSRSRKPLMFNWIRRRRLSADARRKLLLVSARAEEAVVETHVVNILDLLDTLGDEVDFDHA